MQGLGVYTLLRLVRAHEAVCGVTRAEEVTSELFAGISVILCQELFLDEAAIALGLL